MQKPNIHRHTLWQNKSLTRFVLPFFVSILLLTLFLALLPLTPNNSTLNPKVSAATSDTLNFQGRLLTNTGALVPDGTYNVEFNLYNVSSGGSTLWTEDRLNTNTQGVTVKNGYFSVYLGEYDAFGAITWSENMYLGMTIRGTGSCAWGSCTPTDSEMTPRFKLSAVPYAFSSKTLTTTDSGFTSTLELATPTANRTITAPDESGTICLTSGNCAGVGGTGDILQGGNTLGANILIGTNDAYSLTLETANTPAVTINTSQLLQFNAYNCTTFANGGALTTDASGNVTCSDDDGGGGGGSLFTDAGAATYLTATGDTLLVGASTANGGKLEVVSTTEQLRLSYDASNNTTFTVSSGGDLTVTPSGGQLSLAGDLEVTAGNYLSLAGGNTASRPGSPTEGMVYFDTTTDSLLTYANGKWQSDRGEFVVVAANDSTQAEKDSADYVADGTADQTEINSALTEAAGGKVILLAGTYIASTTILVPDNTTLAGVGPGTIIEFADIDVSDDLIENSNSTTGTKVVIRDLKLDGRDDLNTAGFQNGINFNDMGGGSGAGARQGGQILNTIIEDFRGSAVNLYDSINNLVDGNTMQGNGQDGVNGSTASSNVISNNIFLGNNKGVYLTLGTNNVITGNTANGNTVHGLQINASDYNTLSGNTTNNNGQNGIDANSGDYSIITGNTSEGNTFVGIDTSGDYVSITGNTSSGNGTHGIGILSDYATVTGNVVRNNTSYGIGVNSSNHSVISSNTVSTNALVGINITGTYNQVSSNRIHDNGGSTGNDGIYTTGGDYSSFTNNLITDTACTTTCRAIMINGSGSVKNYLEGNKFSGSAANAATISDGGTGTIYVNQQTNSTTSTNSDVSDFTFRGSANSATAFAVQNASGASILTVDTTNAELEVGNTTTAGRLVISDGSSNTATILVASTSGDYTYTIPTTTANDTFCLLTLANCAGLSSTLVDNTANAWDIQEGTNNYININTTNTSEAISFGNTTTNPDYNFLGTGLLSINSSLTVNNDSELFGTLAVVNTAPDAPGGNGTGLITTLGSTTNDQFGTVIVSNVTASATGSANNYAGLYSGLLSTSANLSNDELMGVVGSVQYNSVGGSLGTAFGAALSVVNIGSGTIADATGLMVVVEDTSTGSITNGKGIAIIDVATATNNNNLFIGTGVQPAGNWSIYNNSTYANFFGGSLTVDAQITSGDAGTAGSLRISDGSSNYITLDVDAQSSDYSISVPTLAANDEICLLVLGNCVGGTGSDEIITVAADDSSVAEKAAADYVADGTSDEDEINSALTAAAGGKVILLPGTFVADGTILIPNNTTLEGEGNGTIIQLDVGSGTDNLIENTDISTGTGVTIKDISLDGSSGTGGTQYGIYLNNMGAAFRDGAKLENINVYGFDEINGTGVVLYQSDFNTITNSIISGNTAGLQLEESENNRINNNSFYSNNGDANIVLLSSSNFNTISDNNLYQGLYGIYIISSSDNLITSNIINDTGGSQNNNGIYLSSAAYNNITNNLIADSGCTTTCYAINIASGTKNYLEGNRYSGSATDAASINDAGTNTIYVNQQTNSTTSINDDVSDFRFRGSANSTTAFAVQNASGVSVLNIDTTNGEVELGNTTTAGKLVVNNGTGASIYLTAAGQDNGILFQDSGMTQGVTGGGLQVTIGGATNDADNASLLVGATTDNTTYTARSTTASGIFFQNGAIQFFANQGLTAGNTFSPSTRLTILESGEIGISDTSPDYQFTVGSAADQFGVEDGVLYWEGSSSDAYETTLQVVNPTADITYQLANVAAGTYEICTTAGTAACLSAYSGGLSATLADNTANAWDIQEGTNNYININTTNTSENISLGNATTNPSYSFLGSGNITFGALLNGVALNSDIIQFQNGGGNKRIETSGNGSGSSISLEVRSGDSAGASETSGNVIFRSGDGTGTGTDSGDVYIDAGSATGTAGVVSLGSVNASALTLGRTGVTTTNAGALTVTQVLTASSTSTFTGLSTFDGNLRISDGSSNYATITVDPLAANYSIKIPTITANDEICLLVLGNCSGGTGSDEIITVAANDSSAAEKAAADYLADGTSDEDEINSALTAATGGKVILLPGTFVADGTILIPNNTTLEGSGSGTIIQLADIDATDNLIETTGTNKTGQVIKDLTLDGQDDLNTVGSQQGIYLLSVGDDATSRQGATIINVTIFDFSSQGIAMNATDNTVIKNSNFYGNNQGIRTEGAFGYNNVIESNLITNNDDDGIQAVGVNYTIIDNTAEDNGGNGIYLNTISESTVSSNTVNNNAARGLYLYNFDDSTATANTALNNGGGGIEYFGVGSTISSNSVSGNTSEGIYLVSTTNSTVIGNTVTSNTSEGIFLNSADNNIIENNIVSSNSYGIRLSAADTNIVSGNNISSNGGTSTNRGVYLVSSDYNTISNNIISDTSCDSSCYAIDIFDSGSDKNYLEGNRYWDTDVDAGDDASINNTGTNTIFVNQQTNTVTSQAYDVSDFRFRGSANSTTAFSVQNAAGSSIFTVDTTNGGVTILNSASTNELYFSGDNETNIESEGSIRLKVDADNDGGLSAVYFNDAAGNQYGAFDEDGTLTVGGTWDDGEIRVVEGGGTSDYVALTATSVTASYTLNLPTAVGSTSQCLQTDSVTATQLVFGACGGGGGSLFTDGGSQTYLTATTDELVIGGSASVGAKLAVIGDADEEQLLIRANASQSVTNPLVLFQNSGGTETSRITISGTRNQAFGQNSLNALTTGTDNTGFGYQALQSATDSVENTAFGSGALDAVATGSNWNVAVGSDAGGGITSGDGNTALGASALMQNTNWNTAIGRSALQYTTGGDNVAVGATAGVGVNGSSTFANSVLLGSGAGSALTTGGNNILLGYQAGNNLTSGANNIIIGYDLDASAVGVSNELNIGNVLRGDTSNGSALFRNTSNTSTAFQVQNASGSNLINVNTTSTSNLVTNGSFETDTTGWSAKTGATLSRITTHQADGNASMQIATAASANSGAQFNYALAASTTYTFYARVKLDSGSMATMELGYSNTGTDVSCSAANTVGTEWTYFSCVFTTAGSVSGTRYVYIKQTDASARNILIDRVQLTATGIEQAYNNGGTIQLLTTISSPLTIQTTQNDPEALSIYGNGGDTYFGFNSQIGTLTIADDDGYIALGENYSGQYGFLVASGTNDAFKVEQSGSSMDILTVNAISGSESVSVLGTFNAGNAVTLGSDAANNLITLGSSNGDTLTVNSIIQGTNALVFEGSGADANETTFAITNPSADRTITFPNATGTVCLQSAATCGFIASSLTDNVADALDIQEGTRNYININTTNAAEGISFGNSTTNPYFDFDGTGTTTFGGSVQVVGSR